MLTALALLVSPAYQFPANKATPYDLTVQFEGYVPVLGGIDGKVDVALKWMITGLEPKESNLRVSADLTDAVIKLDGEKLPFTVDNLKQFFPKNTVTATALGEIKENDAPNLKLPVRLPGLDVKRIPEITYMPIQFPAEIEDGKAFTYDKAFGDSTISYEVTPKMEGSTIHCAVKMKQSYTTYEDEAANQVDDKKDGKSKVETTVTGAGNIDFDMTAGRVITSKIVADAESKVTDIASGKATARHLKTTLDCKLSKPG
jgi:hypothetical protein